MIILTLLKVQTGFPEEYALPIAPDQNLIRTFPLSVSNSLRDELVSVLLIEEFRPRQSEFCPVGIQTSAKSKIETSKNADENSSNLC